MERKASSRVYLNRTQEKQPTVYLLYKNDKIIYVGKSIYPLQRISVHLSHSTNFDSYAFIQCKSKEDMDATEAEYIFEYYPPLNRKMGSVENTRIYRIAGLKNGMENCKLDSKVRVRIIGNALYMEIPKETNEETIEIRKRGDQIDFPIDEIDEIE